MTTLAAALIAANVSFQGLAGFQPRLAAVAPQDAVPGRPVAAVQGKTSHWVRLSGDVNLNGSTYVPAGATSAYVNFSGSTRLQSSDGKISSGYISVNQSEFFWLNGGSFLSGYVRPDLLVSIYRDGKYVGQARVSGTVYVTGYNNNGWVSLSGSGTLLGDISIDD